MTEFLKDKNEAKELVRAWKACLLMEEALQKKLLPVRPEVANQEGRPYFKLPLWGDAFESEFEQFLLREIPSLSKDIGNEEFPFVKKITLGDRMMKKYRQPIVHDFYFGFPTFFYQGKYGKPVLSTPIKSNLDDIIYPVAKSDEELSKILEKTDSAVSISLKQDIYDANEKEAPFWLDEFFLQEDLGISDDKVIELRQFSFEKGPSADEFLEAFCRICLESENQREADDPIFKFFIRELSQYINSNEYIQRSGKRLQIYPFALVYELDKLQPTRQLQNDLDEILDFNMLKGLKTKDPAHFYLFGENAEKTKVKEIKGQYNDLPLTKSQEEVIRAARKRKFSVVQGPPGTGKTHIIRNIFAENLIDFVSGLDTTDERTHSLDALTLLVSTNNRAVDNALEGLQSEPYLPITLRLGSFLVMNRHTLPFLHAYIQKLNTIDPSGCIKEFYQTKDKFKEKIKKLGKGDAAARKNLFDDARALHQTWVVCNKDKVLKLLKKITADLEDGNRIRTLKKEENINFLSMIFPVLGCTLLSVRNIFPLEYRIIGQTIVDEAGQCASSYLLPLLIRSKRAVIIGDTMQLEPVVKMRGDEVRSLLHKRKIDFSKEGIQRFIPSIENPRSAMHVAEEGAKSVLKLRDHFRCAPDIIQVSKELCHYEMDIKTTLKESALPEEGEFFYAPISQKERRYGSSWVNDGEVTEVIKVIQKLQYNQVPLQDIAILTPFRGQLVAVNAELKRNRIPYHSGEADSEGMNSITTGTVHRFQGGEKKVVLFSNVICEGTPTFLNSRVNLLNVAVSRAQRHFIYIGDLEVLSKGGYTSVLKEHLLTAGQQFFP